MGTDNLISLADRTTEEQREIARKGGIRSGEVRRERRRMRELLDTALSAETDYWGETMTNAEAVTAALVKKAQCGDVRAYQTICAMVGEQPAPHVAAVHPISAEAYAEVEALLMGGGDGD